MSNSFTLEVSGTFTTTVGVDYTAADGQALTHIDLPWRHDTLPTSAGTLYLNAVHLGDETGELTCRIIRDGEVIAAMTNNGAPNSISRISCHVTAIVAADGAVQSTDA
ncbi:MmpS family protein [Mycobacteroides salmoniphilum]|uniref:MmpS family transport accessory protein n=1 Tax=Mycobacteroides salmoniphilum TaxID=404941 RepID=UPI0035618F85